MQYAPPGTPPWAPQEPAPSAFREGQREWEPHDGSERWGDIATKQFATAPAAVAAAQLTTQLIRAQSKWPLTWLIQFDGRAILPSAEVAPVNLDFEITYGVGQAASASGTGAALRFRIVLTAANGYRVPPIIPPAAPPNQLFMPAASLQVTCSISYVPTVAAPNAVVQVSAMCAPFTSMSAPQRPGP